MRPTSPWWRNAVFYRADVRSFADSDGDAIGDLDGLRSRLGYLELLGVNALAIGGTDLRDQVESVALLVAEAHEAGIRVAIEVPAAPDVLRVWMDHGVDGFHLATVDEAVAATVAEYPDRVLVGGGQLAFTPHLIDAGFDADYIADIIADGLALAPSVPAWSLEGWGVRHGGDELAPAHARAIAMVALGLPGAVCLQHGEELGLPGGHRTPMPWEGEDPPFGFSDAEGSWLSIPPQWITRTVEAQLEDPDSTLSLYREAMELRNSHPSFVGDDVEWFGAPHGCFAFRRGGDGLICALNSSPEPVPLPPGDVLLSSGPPSESVQAAGMRPEYTAAWLA